MAQMKMVEYQQEGEDNEELVRLDTIRSQKGGDAALSAQTALYSVLTGKAFHLTNYSIYKRNAAGTVWITDSTNGAGATRLITEMANSSYQGETGLEGCMIVASTTTSKVIYGQCGNGSCFIRIGGILRDRMTGETTT